MKTFYLGGPPRWLPHSTVPMFVSVHALASYRSTGDAFPKANGDIYALDSGAYTELDRNGTWSIDADSFRAMVYRFIDALGQLPQFCAPQDWMTEDHILAKTGLTPRIHQELTTENVVHLRQHFPHAPWIPVLQGPTVDDYLAHNALYASAGIHLRREPLVGLGSVCRRQATTQIVAIVEALHHAGIRRLHGFGVKTLGLARCGHRFVSTDSYAWSKRARLEKIHLAGCTHRGTCSSCLNWALLWRQHMLTTTSRRQPITGTVAA